MKSKRRLTRRALLLATCAAPIALASSSGCQTQQAATTLRALERSGRVSFVCLAAPGTIPSVALPVDTCTSVRFDSPDDYAVEGGKTTQPHLYALVTQTTRGEVAVIDMSTKADSILDANPRVPGANFLPVGAQPVDVVSTPGGTATFVAAAEHGREGIYALASKDIRLCSDCEPKTLSDWPSCGLPAAPGRMLVVYDPPQGEDVRASCDGTYEPILRGTDEEEKDVVDTLREGKGRPKLAVTIPELGALAIIDAQSLFDVERDAAGKPKRDENGKTIPTKYAPGSWNACPIERWVPLAVDLPASSPPPPPPNGPACVNEAPKAPAVAVGLSARPSGVALAEDKLYIGDLEAPVIHVLEMKTPCDPVEREPLLPSSEEEPSRVVTTSQLTVSSVLTGSLTRWLYAVDEKGGGLMVFDVGETATSRAPLRRPRPEWAPFQTADRVDFGVPVQDLVIVERDNPQPIPATGVAVEGVRCDPDPNLTVCTASSTTCDPETLYRTGPEFDRGAGPSRLRGAFAYVVLGTGQIAVVDIDDYDEKCRGPRHYTDLYGCPPVGFDASFDPSETLVSSGELSCNVVIPHTPRGANYFMTGDRTGQHQPGLQSFPLLYDNLGALQPKVDPEGVIMRATVPVQDPNEPIAESDFTVAVGSSVRAIDQKTGVLVNAGQLEHTLAMNLEDPRAQSVSQTFTVVYEGAIPGFGGKAAKLDLASNPATLQDAASRFCEQGVLGQKAWKEILQAENEPGDLDVKSKNLADYVQISSSIPPEDDAYWQTEGVAGVCSYQQCNLTFGPAELPATTRDILIAEAYQDHLVLGDPLGVVPDPANPGQTKPIDPETIECCFPTLVNFTIRVHGQWAVLGVGSGFIHHVIATPAETAGSPELVGACRNTCDPRVARKNSRVRPSEFGKVVKDGDREAFINPFFRFAINNPKNGVVRRNTFLQFTTQGNFRPLIVNLAASSSEIQPQAISFVSPTNELALTDGSLEGLILLSAGQLNVTRQYY